MLPRKKMKKTKLILVVVLVSVILISCLGFLGYFGVKTMRRTYLRMQAREAFAAEDWKRAEKLLKEYVGKDPGSEEDVVRLAQVYNHFGNTGEEMYCWYKANTLNPLKPEYWNNYTGCAMNARDFTHLYSALSRKIGLNTKLAPKDMMLHLICAVITDRANNAGKYYEHILKADPEAFRRDDLGRFTEFLITYKERTPVDRSIFLESGIKSDDPFVRFESILFSIASLNASDSENAESILEQKETMLKQAVELNRFAATPLLASFYFTHLRFSSVIELAEPYLADIDDILLSILYAESCVYSGHPEKLIPLAEKFHSLGWKYRMQASYFEALYDFTQDNNDDLAKHMQEIGNAAQTDLANLMNLQVALNNDNEEKIVSILETIMTSPPFYDLQNRARSAVQYYLWSKIQEKTDFADDPRIIKLAQLISGPDQKDPLLIRIMISDLRKRNILTQQIIQENLEAFPSDPYLLEVAAEYELFNGDPEKCLEYVERFYALEKEERSITFDHLHMLALELTGKIDEATKDFTAMVDNHKMDREILYRYLRFCIDHERKEELAKMEERLDVSDVPDLKALAPFFRMEELLLQDKEDEALSLLETVKTDQPGFALRAANLCSAYGMLEQALSRYLALVDKHPNKRLIFANIAEVYLAKEMKPEALSYAKQVWEMNQDNSSGQFIYAKMLAANGQYQDAEKILRIPRREIELPDEVRELWTDIMYHVIETSMEGRQFLQAEDLLKHLLIVLPDDEFGKENLEKVRKLIKSPKKEDKPGDMAAAPAPAA